MEQAIGKAGSETTAHYDEKYFLWQKRMGEFGGRENLFKFSPFIRETDNVVDFGCGGGFLLANVRCKDSIGVEINPTARENARQLGIKTVESADLIEDNWADVIISEHALEHALRPYDELKKLHPKLKKGGKIIFVLPHEIRTKYDPSDINQHLYTWSPLNAGNLFAAAGFKVERVETFKHRWPPAAFFLRQLLGSFLFHLLCRVYARCFVSFYSVRVVAVKS